MKTRPKKSAPEKRSVKIIELDRRVSQARLTSEAAHMRAKKAKVVCKHMRKVLKLAKKAAKKARNEFKILKRALNKATRAAIKPPAAKKKKNKKLKSNMSQIIRLTVRSKPAASAGVLEIEALAPAPTPALTNPPAAPASVERNAPASGAVS